MTIPFDDFLARERDTTPERPALTVQVSFRLPAEHAEALRVIAAREDRTLSAHLRRLIRAHCRAREAA